MNVIKPRESQTLAHLDNFSVFMGGKGELVLAHLHDFKVTERH